MKLMHLFFSKLKSPKFWITYLVFCALAFVNLVTHTNMLETCTSSPYGMVEVQVCGNMGEKADRGILFSNSFDQALWLPAEIYRIAILDKNIFPLAQIHRDGFLQMEVTVWYEPSSATTIVHALVIGLELLYLLLMTFVFLIIWGDSRVFSMKATLVAKILSIVILGYWIFWPLLLVIGGGVARFFVNPFGVHSRI